MIKCNKCGTENPNGSIMCEKCGEMLDAPILPENVDEKGRVKGSTKKQKHEKAAKPKASKKEKKQRSDEEREAIRKNFKNAAIVICVIAVICLIVWIISLSEGNKGLKAAESIPLGRNVEYAASETKLEFTKTCENGIVNNMADFDYICVSGKNVKVSGSEQPEWAVMLNIGADDLITSVEYYDFSQLKLNWKGRRNSVMLDQNSLDFGMSIRNVSKTLGFKPYYIKRNVNNEAVYCYRYYFFDENTGCDRAFNYYVEFTDVDNTVKNVYYDEIDYAGVILSAAQDEPEPVQDTDPEAYPEDGETEENSESDEDTDSEE
ncbi:MAG: hypothetical protein ACI4KF_13805 [Huintestinicola sp.]